MRGSNGIAGAGLIILLSAAGGLLLKGRLARDAGRVPQLPEGVAYVEPAGGAEMDSQLRAAGMRVSTAVARLALDDVSEPTTDDGPQVGSVALPREVRPANAGDLISRSRRLAGWGRGADRIFIRGKASVDGRQANFSLLAENSGRFLLDVEDRVTQRSGFDGAESWTIGRARSADSGRLEVRIPPVVVWVMTGAWLEPDSPCRLRALPAGTDRGPRSVELRSAALDQPVKVVLDPDTGLPGSLVMSDRSEAWSFSEFRVVRGHRLPHTLRRTSRGVTQLLTVEGMGTPSAELLAGGFSFPERVVARNARPPSATSQRRPGVPMAEMATPRLPSEPAGSVPETASADDGDSMAAIPPMADSAAEGIPVSPMGPVVPEEVLRGIL